MSNIHPELGERRYWDFFETGKSEKRDIFLSMQNLREGREREDK